MDRTLLLILVLSMLAVNGCVENPTEAKEGWVYRYPVGCVDNLWQQEWVVSHGMNFSGYPREKDTQLFLEHLGRHNITLLKFEQEPYPTLKELEDCTSCSCPRGDVFFLLVPIQDLEKVKTVGFKEPSQELKCKTDQDCTTAEDCCGCEKGGIRIPINKGNKRQWEEKLECQTICPNKASDHPYCNKTLDPKCQHNQCTLK